MINKARTCTRGALLASDVPLDTTGTLEAMSAKDEIRSERSEALALEADSRRGGGACTVRHGGRRYAYEEPASRT
jgi:hypothetical protein